MANNIITRWIDDFAASLRECGTRFPTTVFFITALTVWCLFLNHENCLDNDRLTITLTYYLSVGIPLSLLLQLWGEEMKSNKRRIATNIIGQLLLLGDAIFLYLLSYTSLAIMIAHVAAIVALVIAIFLISYLKEGNDVPCWNFAIKSLIAYIKASVICILFTCGIELLMVSIGILFNINIDYELHLDVTIICNVGLTHLIFIGMLPDGAAKHDNLPRTNNFLTILVRYVFMPLTAAYMLVLYAYAIRIIFMWELPNGWVSWLVTALMAGCILIEIGLYPFRQFPVKKKTDELIARWLPILIMPLLVLMTIGIIRRFNDYGITVMRLYLSAFNLWCYAVCITLFLTRARRISWIPASFAVIFLFTSILPKYNFANITLDTLRNDISAAMAKTCTDTPPLTEEQYANWINNVIPQSEGQRINDKFIYLQDMYDANDYKYLAADSIYFYTYKAYDGVNVDTITAEGYYGFFSTLHDGIDIPDGATRITEVQLFGYENSTLIFHKNEQLPIGLNEKDTIYIDFPTLEKLNNNCENIPYSELPQNHHGFKFILTELTGHINDNDSINIAEIDGYIFQLNNITTK